MPYESHIRIETDYKNAISALHTTQTKNNSAIFPLLKKIQSDIHQRGDKAVLSYTLRFDHVSNTAFQLRVTDKEIEEAYRCVGKPFIKAIRHIQKNLNQYHKKQYPKSWDQKKPHGIAYGARYLPIEKVGLYVPGGRAPYPSTVLMNAVPAKIAGVPELIIATPPNKDGVVSPYILVAADICGICSVFKVGGAQAVFALAYGTESIPKVDKIVGPGNQYVTLAKQMVYGAVDIDKPAGPSEVLAYIDKEEYAAFAASELLAQLEHGPDSWGILVSENSSILETVQKEVHKQFSLCTRQDILAESLKRSFLIQTFSQSESIEAINLAAPEHLVLLSDRAKAWLKSIRNAGSIFIGPYSTVTLGDYFAGPNHVLPTGGAARFSSPLGVMDFMKYSSVLSYSKAALKKAEPSLKLLTSVEGLDAHYRTVSIRLEDGTEGRT